jgi:hypothetical protein
MSIADTLRRADENAEALRSALAGVVEVLESDLAGAALYDAIDAAHAAACAALTAAAPPDPPAPAAARVPVATAVDGTPTPGESVSDFRPEPHAAPVEPRPVEARSTKRCPGCEQTKPREEFSRNRAAYDGLQSRCKACQRRPGGRGEAVRGGGKYDANLKAIDGALKPVGGPRGRVTVTCPRHGDVTSESVPIPGDPDAWSTATLLVDAALHHATTAGGCDAPLHATCDPVDDVAVPISA